MNKTIVVTFSESIQKGTMNIILYDAKGNKISCTNTIKANTLTINPKNNLKKGMKYSIVIHSGSVKDLSGNKYLYKGAYTFTCIAASKKVPVIGYWMFSSEAKYLTTSKVTALKQKGVTDVYVMTKDASGTIHNTELSNAIRLCHAQNIRVHAWFACFKTSSGWANPANTAYQNTLLSQIKSVIKNHGVDGISLDYVRYPGTACYYSGASDIIANFVSKVNNIIGNKKLSCVVMSEGSTNAKYYGQDYSKLTKYCDYLLPMTYKGNYGENDAWITSMTKYIVQHSNGKPVYTGLTTYYGDNNLRTLTATEMQNDVNAAKKGGAAGITLFKYNYGYKGSVNF